MRKPASGTLDPSLAEQASTRTKAMIGLASGGRPLMDYLLYNARLAGYHDIVMVINDRDDSVRRYYGGGDRENRYGVLKISYAIQRIPEGRNKPLGTADALLQGLLLRPDWKGQQVTACNSDNLYSRNALELLRLTEAHCAMIDYDRAGLDFARERIEQFAVVIKDQNGFLSSVVEKPTPEEVNRARDPGGRIGVSMNLWRFLTDSIMPFLEKVPLHPLRQEKEIPAAVMMMISSGGSPVQAIPLREHVPDLTSRDDIDGLRRFLEREYPEISL
jgi:glucose-1-phosphate thymidylyltransferase